MLDHAAELFEEGDTNHDGSLSCNEILLLMRKVTCLPFLSVRTHGSVGIFVHTP